MEDFGPSFWSGLIYIILVALIMTIFELLFFTLFAGPNETTTARNYVKNIKHSFSSLFAGASRQPLNQQTHDFLNVSIARENKLNKQINDGAITLIGLEIIILLMLIILVWFILKSHVGTNKFWNRPQYAVQPSLFSALIVCTVIMAFQGSMYDFAQHYYYPTDNELKYKIVTKLKADLNL